MRFKVVMALYAGLEESQRYKKHHIYQIAMLPMYKDWIVRDYRMQRATATFAGGECKKCGND